jgi:hypothetical protein
MGNKHTFHGLGQEPPLNGHDDLYGPRSWRDSIINKKPTHVSAKRFVVMFSIDVVALFVMLRILNDLSDVREIVVLGVSIMYLTGRAVIIWVKFLNFYGKNAGSIAKGWKAFKDMFKE